jgi:hypothetical protein
MFANVQSYFLIYLLQSDQLDANNKLLMEPIVYHGLQWHNMMDR